VWFFPLREEPEKITNFLSRWRQLQIEMTNYYENNQLLTVIPASEPESNPPAGGLISAG